MKALTLWRPYAHLIAIGEKRVENRRWPTRYRGRLAIHAGLSRKGLGPGDEANFPEMAFGAIVATTTLVACIHIRDVGANRLPPELAWVRGHPYTDGPWCWILTDAYRLADPAPCRGNRSLWNLPDELLPRLEQPIQNPNSQPRAHKQGGTSESHSTPLRPTRDRTQSRRQAARVSRLLKRLHVHGLIAKIQRSRRWRVTHKGHALMTMVLMLHDQHYPQALAGQAA